MGLSKVNGPWCAVALLSGAAWLGQFPRAASAQSSHPEVLVVYNTSSPESLTVANHYLSQRNIPSSNLCAITPPANDIVSFSDYNTFVKGPVRNCLNVVGPKNILYIVFSYLTPYIILGPGPVGGAALDSYAADIWDKYATQPFSFVPNVPHGYYADSQGQGNSFQPFASFASYRANPRSTMIYAVWRLDGPSAAIASALVDQAITAESTGGPIGQACIDRQYGDLTSAPDTFPLTTDWDLHAAAGFLRQAGVTVVEDANAAEFGTAPAPLTCSNAAFFSGWYSLENYNDAFTWPTGAIGWHIESGAAFDVRHCCFWVPSALQRGIAVTSGAVAEPQIDGIPRPGGLFRNLLEGANVGDAFLRNTKWLKWEILNVGDPLYRPFGAGRAPFSPLQRVNSFSIAPREIVGGKTATGTIVLSAAAPAGGLTFTLDNGFSTIAFVPPTVTVAPGASQVSFTITSAAVPNPESPAVITATSPSVTVRNTVNVNPLLGGLTAPVEAITPGVSGGTPVTVSVSLFGPAPAGGAVIGLSSNNPAASVPASVTVPAGSAVASFNITTTPVPFQTAADITASYAGAFTDLIILINP